MTRPAVIKEEGPRLIAICHTMVDWYLYDACLYLKKNNGGGVSGGGAGALKTEEMRRQERGEMMFGVWKQKISKSTKKYDW